MFDIEHMAVVIKKSPQIASNALNKEYNMRQDNILTR